MNTAIHAIMYGYYLLTILRPEIKSNHSLKKNITRMQIVSFSDYFSCIERSSKALPQPIDQLNIEIFVPNCGFV